MGKVIFSYSTTFLFYNCFILCRGRVVCGDTIFDGAGLKNDLIEYCPFAGMQYLWYDKEKMKLL